MKKVKFFTKYNCENSDNMDKEIIVGDSLIDRSVIVPTLEQYISQYMVTGRAPFVNREEVEDDNEEFTPMDIRTSDIEDVKEYCNDILYKVKKNVDDRKVTENLETNIKQQERKEENKENDDLKDKN